MHPTSQFQILTKVRHITTNERNRLGGTMAVRVHAPDKGDSHCSVQLLVVMWVHRFQLFQLLKERLEI